MRTIYYALKIVIKPHVGLDIAEEIELTEKQWNQLVSERVL